MARNYPGFLAAFFIILLRVAIGWHFLNEGIEKYESSQHGKERFSAEIYLRNANGPLAPYFRGMVPDVDSRDMLDAVEAEGGVAGGRRAGRRPLRFQRGPAEPGRASSPMRAERWADVWFSDPENVEKREKYLHDLDQVEQTEHDPNAMSYEHERAWEARRSVDADRRSLIAPADRAREDLRDAVAKLATTDQARPKRRGDRLLVKRDRRGQLATRPPAGSTLDQLDVINMATTYGLIAIGVCLILGFLTPLAALGGRGVPGHDLPVHAPVARPAPQPEDRGALLHRQQEPDRADRLPGDRHHAERPLDRPRRVVLRRPAPPTAGSPSRRPSRTRTRDRATTARTRPSDRELAEDHQAHPDRLIESRREVTDHSMTTATDY